MKEAIPLISMLTALLAVVVGPIVTCVVARRQIRANTISANRQAWINSLRDSLAEYLAKVTIARRTALSGQTAGHAHQYQEEIVRLGTRITLLLNPHKADQKKIIAGISNLSGAMNPSSQTDPHFNADACQAEIVTLSQALVKKEWERVKSGG